MLVNHDGFGSFSAFRDCFVVIRTLKVNLRITTRLGGSYQRTLDQDEV